MATWSIPEPNQATWSIPAPTEGEWLEVSAQSYGDAYAQAVAEVATTTEGTSTTGAVALQSQTDTATTTEGAGTQGSVSVPSLASATGTEGTDTSGSTTAASVVGVTTGGLKTPVLTFSEDRRQATAEQGIGFGPTTYDHTGAFTGDQLQLTTSKV